ncbi:MAG: 7TM diverse intracellular signaling domain-containing protein [Bacteroidota bacterium]
MKNTKHRLSIFFFLISFSITLAQNQIVLTDENFGDYIGKHIEILKDSSFRMTIQDVKSSKKFTLNSQDVPGFGFTKAAIWVKFQIKNSSSQHKLLLELDAPLIDEAELFTMNNDSTFSSTVIGQNFSFFKRKYAHTSYLYDLYLDQGEVKTYFVKIKSFDQVEIPLKITTPLVAFSSSTTHNYLIGIYSGIMLIMIFYNLFIYFSVRDKSYLYYVIYILAVLITQITFQGYTFKYIWPNNPKFELLSIMIFSVFVGYASVQFLRVFLNTKKFIPKLDKVFLIAYICYGVAAILVIVGYHQKSWQLILAIVSPLSLFMLYVGFKIARMGYRPAKFFTIAWSFFLVGVFIHAMKSSGILPYNNFTVYTMTLGSAIETILLSFALADRINILKKEKEESQATALDALKENEKLIIDQNIVLERNVEQRTIELKNTLSNLKETQAQLVNAEKMASLGQLTAGIAHEINNPINFVSANVKPLKLDIGDVLTLLEKYELIASQEISAGKLMEIEKFKKEIDIEYLKKEMADLLSGIEDGAKRTADIVSGLKNFSRLDESDIKHANINEGIESTLILLKSAIPENTDLVIDLGAIPLIECLPGKLNQVFMNLFSNALYAISRKNNNSRNSLTIKTYASADKVFVSIVDTGIGMTAEVKAKIFDPFFTTKDVGEGTGLGMSIVFKIIESHRAVIEVESEQGVGTKILLILNKKVIL